MQKLYRSQGVMLIEMVLGIVVIAILFVSFIGVMRTVYKNASSPIHQIEALHYAAYMMDEILSHPVNMKHCDKPKNRVDIQSLCQYQNVKYKKNQIEDIQGNKLADLKNYELAVSIDSLNIDGVKGVLVDVTVMSPLGDKVVLSGVKVDNEK